MAGTLVRDFVFRPFAFCLDVCPECDQKAYLNPPRAAYPFSDCEVPAHGEFRDSAAGRVVCLTYHCHRCGHSWTTEYATGYAEELSKQTREEIIADSRRALDAADAEVHAGCPHCAANTDHEH